MTKDEAFYIIKNITEDVKTEASLHGLTDGSNDKPVAKPWWLCSEEEIRAKRSEGAILLEPNYGPHLLPSKKEHAKIIQVKAKEDK